MVGTISQAAGPKVIVGGPDDRIPVIEIGNSKAEFPPGLVGLFRTSIVRDAWFRAVIVDGQIRVSAVIRDESGAIVAELVDNEWQVAGEPTAFERNYSSNALEVKDAKGRVVLQVVALPDRIQLQLMTYTSEGHAIFVAVERDKPFGPFGVGLVGSIPKGSLMKWPEIRPIFRYPSRTHLGELAFPFDDNELPRGRWASVPLPPDAPPPESEPTGPIDPAKHPGIFISLEVPGRFRPLSSF